MWKNGLPHKLRYRFSYKTYKLLCQRWLRGGKARVRSVGHTGHLGGVWSHSMCHPCSSFAAAQGRLGDIFWDLVSGIRGTVSGKGQCQGRGVGSEPETLSPSPQCFPSPHGLSPSEHCEPHGATKNSLDFTIVELSTA